jgi:pyridoxamine 5'-phosphate oxidase
MNPFNEINEWLEKESALAPPNPVRIILATASISAIPSARVLAIREINESGILFFTQRDTRKTAEIAANEHVSGVIWLPMQQRQIGIEGIARPIRHEENLHYWQTMPHERQLRFSAYAPTSGQRIESINVLETKYQMLKNTYQQSDVPMSEFYCGYRIIPAIISFYTLGNHSFSEVKRCTKSNAGWNEESISP